jgi:hypothetical protein
MCREGVLCINSSATIGLIHSRYSTDSMILASSILSISTLNFYLYIGFNVYGHCLIDIASGLSGILISPISLAIPFISINVVGNRSLYSRNNSVMLSTSAHHSNIQCWPFLVSKLLQC